MSRDIKSIYFPYSPRTRWRSLASTSEPQETPDIEHLQQLDYDEHVDPLWFHETDHKVLTDDRRDKASKAKRREQLDVNRPHLEATPMASTNIYKSALEPLW